jgi:hypothetical protein
MSELVLTHGLYIRWGGRTFGDKGERKGEKKKEKV